LKNKKRIAFLILVSAAAIAALFVSAWFFVSWQLSRPDTYKASITKIVGKELNRQVNYESGKASLTFSAGLTVHFTNVEITDQDGSSFLSIKAAFFRLSLLPLLRNKFVFNQIILDRPRLSLKRDRSGALNFADLLKRKKEKTALEFREIAVEKGCVTFSDQASRAEGLVTSWENAAGVVSPEGGNKFAFRVSASVVESKNKAALELNGTFAPAPDAKPLSESFVQASFRIKGANLQHYHPYLKKIAPVASLAGTMDAEAKLSGTVAGFTSRGNVRVQDAVFCCPQAFRKPLAFRQVFLDYALTRGGGRLHLDVARLAIDRFEAGGRLDISEMDQNDPFVEAAVSSSATLSLKEMQPYLPWEVMPKQVAGFIKEHVKEGNFRLVEGKLRGRKSRIVRIAQKENAGVLSLRAEVSDGVFTAGPAAPAFRGISGTMELKNRRFFLRKMAGRFGSSPFTMEGSISDFALPGPVEYAADMTVHPVRDEVLWLLGKEKFRAFRFDGASTLVLSGKGRAEHYVLKAGWDLTDAAYAFPDAVEKPGARKNYLTAEIILDRDGVNISSFDYELPPVRVSGSAARRVSGEIPLSARIQSDAFNIREAVVVLPVLKKLHPAGTCLIDVSGRGDLRSPGSIQWEGDVSFNNVSFKPPAGVGPVTNLTGKAIFKKNKMETTLLNVRVGQSVILASFRMDELRKPALNCRFQSDLFRAADLGLQSTEGDVNFSGLKGSMVIGSRHIHVDELSFGLGKSVFKLSGDIRDFDAPMITAELVSPYLHAEDASRLAALRRPEKENEAASKIKLKAAVRVETCAVKNVDFKNLHILLNFASRTVNIESLEAGFFDGKIRARGQAVFHDGGRNAYSSKFSLDRVSLEKLHNILHLEDRMLTGRLSLDGDVSAAGRHAGELKTTAAGTLRVRAEQGVLKKFSVLSKIFSLLNVLQLAKMHLPDMAAGGMPFHAITADMSFKEGVLSSKNFFIASDAMELSGAGRINYLSKEIDCIGGIHPLQSLDRVAAKIPVVGWLITDEQGRFLTVYVKIDGKLHDPDVKPMPVRSIGKETLDIFRRLFQLPEKMITDTDEVLWGR
jgi:uncharacterized protein YhdP